MRDPWQQFKQLPWIPLLQIAALAVFVMTAVEMVLLLGAQYVPLIGQAVGLLFAPPLGILMAIAMSAALGAIAVWSLEIVRRDIYITTGVLWALVPCLLLMLLLKSLSGFPAIVSTDQGSLIGMALGIFWKGKAHWR